MQSHLTLFLWWLCLLSDHIYYKLHPIRVLAEKTVELNYISPPPVSPEGPRLSTSDIDCDML